MLPPLRSPALILLAAMLILPAAPLPAEGPPAGAATETVRVQLAQFDVVVRDKAGRIVTGLGRDDFEVLEDGRLLEIEAVDAWGEVAPPANPAAKPEASPAQAQVPSATPAATTAPPREMRSFVLLFDALTTTSALRLHQAKRAAAGFVRTQLSSEDLVSVYKLDATLRPQTGFSRDRAATAAAIEAIGWMPNESFEDEIAESVLAYRSRAGAGVMNERLTRGALLNHQTLDWTRDSFYRMLQSVAGAFEGLPGRHVLVLLSPGLPMTTAGDFNRETGGFTSLFRDLLKELARQGITVYSIDIGDDLALGDASNVDWRLAAGKIGMDEQAVADLGLDRSMGAGSASQRRQVLGVLAAETGGRLLTHSDLGKAFTLVDEESSRFYRISCKVPERSDTARYHRVVIRVKKPDMEVASRRGRYGDVVPGSAGRPGDASRQVVDSLARYRNLPLRGALTVLPSADGGPARVGVVVEALGPVELPRGQNGEASLDLDFIVVARAGGEVVARSERPLRATVQPQGVSAVEKGFRLEAALALPPGPYEVQANVRMERPAQFASWKADLVVPPPPEGAALRFDEVVLAPPPDATPLLVQVREETDPFALGAQARLLPATAASYPAQGALSAMFWLRGLAVPEGGAPKLQLAVEVADASGKTRTLPAKLAMFQPDGRGGHRGLVEIDLAGLPPGGYALTLRASDQGQDVPAAVAHRGFEIR